MINSHNRSIAKDLHNFIEKWNILYPVDGWWRRKYNVPFGSEKHRAADFFMMIVEWEEEKMFKEIVLEQQRLNKKEDFNLDDLQDSTSTGSVINKVMEMDEEEINEEYNKLNLAEFNDKLNQ